MRKLFSFIVLVLALGICFVGCEHYEQEDADRITEKGNDLMRLWLDEHMPDAEITECSAFTQNIRYSSHVYLTDYATGQICKDGEELVFTIDTVTGAVYFENDQSTKRKLNELAAAYLYETMGITLGGSDDYFECYVLAPFRDEDHELKAYQFDYGFDFGLPAGVEDLGAFVRDPASRPLLYVQATITLPDDADLYSYDLAAMAKLSEECGMLFGSIRLENGSQVFQNRIQDWVTKADFYEYGRWLERDGIYFYGRVSVREEERNDLTGELTVSDRRFDPEQDLVFEETATGYRYYMPNEDWQEVFTIHVSEGGGILEHDYMEYCYPDVAGFIEGKYDSDEKEGTETIWIEQSNGSYVLSSKANQYPISFSHAGKLERIQ